MAKAKNKFEPTKFFGLMDIALWTTSLRREGDYQPHLHDGKTEVQTMRSVRAEVFSVQLDGDSEATDLIRVFVTFGIRTATKAADSPALEVLHSLEATFAVDHTILAEPDEVEINQFISKNCPHLAWPFWRQHVYDTFKRASLPTPVVPLLSSGAGKRPRRITRITQTERVAPALGDVLP